MHYVIRNIGYLVTMDQERQVLTNAWVEINEGRILGIGNGEPPTADSVVDAKHGIALPGLVNTHHHMYQNLVRAYTPVANLPLLPWVAGVNAVARGLTYEDLSLAAEMAMAELMLSGCTTTSDHHYVFPRGIPNLMDAEFEAAEAMGIRFHGCRGCMDIPSEFDPPTLIQTTDEILNDYQRVLERWHDPSPGSMRQVAFAPSGILCSTPDLLRETARMGQKYKIRLHIHCGETKEEQQRSLAKFGSRPLQYLAEAGWSEDNVWLAHGIHFDDKEVGFLNQHGIGIAHCPCSNMRLGSGVCRVTELRGGGSPVSLGVDGSASNDSGHMLNEVRQALLLNRVIYGASSMRVEEALEMATLEGARNLGRSNEIGSVEVGKCADLAIFPANDLFSNGAENVVHSLVLCFPRKVETLVINGKVRVRDGELLGTDLPDLLRCHAAAANRLHQQ